MKEWKNLKDLHEKQCYKIDNTKTQKQLWNFWSSLDFCATVLTTIGTYYKVDSLRRNIVELSEIQPGFFPFHGSSNKLIK